MATPDRTVTTNSKESDGQLTPSHYSTPRSTDVTYKYGVNGLRTSLTDSTATSSSAYSANGQMTDQSNGAGQALTFTYNTLGQ